MNCSDCEADVGSMPPNVLALRLAATPKLEAGDWAMRSCGHCNGAHKHLMEGDGFLFRCFCCGHLYYGGERVTSGEGEEP